MDLGNRGTESVPPSVPSENGGATSTGQFQWILLEITKQSAEIARLQATLDNVHLSAQETQKKIDGIDSSVRKISTSISRVVWSLGGGLAVIMFLISDIPAKMLAVFSKLFGN